MTDNFNTRVADKELIVHNDFALGAGTVQQTRFGITATEQKIELEFIFRTTSEITALDLEKYNHVALVADDFRLYHYRYDATSGATADGDLVLNPDGNLGLGRWLRDPTPIETGTSYIVENVAALKALALPAGMRAETKGYYTPGDGGHATYLIKTAADYGNTPDEYGDHTLANGNIAVLQYSGSVDMKQFGATGDGTTDDTVAIQAGLDAYNDIYVSEGDFRVTAQINLRANTTILGIGTILVDQSPYVRAFFVSDNTRIEGITFRGTGVPDTIDEATPGGQRGMAIAGTGIANVKVLNCQFYNFKINSINTGIACISLSGADAIEISKCYFDMSNDRGSDIDVSYYTGNTIITNNVSYSNSDLFCSIASITQGNVGTSTVPDSCCHTVSNNILIKGYWEQPAHGELGRHGILCHYAGGVSRSIITNNVIGNVARHGIYLRGDNDDLEELKGPDIISNNYLLHCGVISSDPSDYYSAIRIENNMSGIISDNTIEKTGYYPDGSIESRDPDTNLWSDIECVRGTANLIIANNVLHDAAGGSINMLQSVSNTETLNINITGNNIRNAKFGIGINCQVSSNARTSTVKVDNNIIELTGANYKGNRSVGIFEFNSGFPVDPLDGDETVNWSFTNNIIKNSDTTNKTGRYGICLGTTANKVNVINNSCSNLEWGLAAYRFDNDTVTYFLHRVFGIEFSIAHNRFSKCEVGIKLNTNDRFLLLVDPSNLFMDCTITGVSLDRVTWNTAVQGRVIGIDSNQNKLVEFKADTVPTLRDYYAGDRIIANVPTAGGSIGQVCVTSGDPGVWKSYGSIDP